MFVIVAYAHLLLLEVVAIGASNRLNTKNSNMTPEQNKKYLHLVSMERVRLLKQMNRKSISSRWRNNLSARYEEKLKAYSDSLKNKYNAKR